MVTRFKGSCGRVPSSFRKPSNEVRNALGVRSSGARFNQVDMLLKRASTSSWLCPEDKKEMVHCCTLRSPTWHAAHNNTPLFFSSLLALSPWRFKWVDLRSNPFCTISDNPWEMISMVRLLLHETKCGDSTVKATKPCINKVVELIRGLDHEANSLALMLGDLGHECFAASIESMMAVTVEGLAEDEANLLKLLKCQ